MLMKMFGSHFQHCLLAGVILIFDVAWLATLKMRIKPAIRGPLGYFLIPRSIPQSMALSVLIVTRVQLHSLKWIYSLGYFKHKL